MTKAPIIIALLLAALLLAIACSPDEAVPAATRAAAAHADSLRIRIDTAWADTLYMSY